VEVEEHAPLPLQWPLYAGMIIQAPVQGEVHEDSLNAWRLQDLSELAVVGKKASHHQPQLRLWTFEHYRHCPTKQTLMTWTRHSA